MFVSAFLAANMAAFALDGSLIDAQMLQLSTGKLNLPQQLKVERGGPGATNTIVASWVNNPLLEGDRLYDELLVVSGGGGIYSRYLATEIV